MPKQHRKRGGIFALSFLAVGIIGCCVVVIAIMYIGLPTAVSRIGEPAPEQDPLNRLFLIGYLWLNINAIDTPAGDTTLPYELEVIQGENATSVVGKLKAAGVIENDVLLRNFLLYRGYDRGIDAGKYTLHGGMTIREISLVLQKADPQAVHFVVFEGWRREQIAEAIDIQELGFSSIAYLDASKRVPDHFAYSENIPVFATLEGFLFPDTYSISPEMDAEDFIERVLENFSSRITAEIISGFERQGLDIYEGITLASIVEREAVISDERDLIASVFINRLNIGMQLEADPTVQYALGQQLDGSWWKAPLTFDDLEIDSPYNTYRYPGLPPGPIANPGLDSIEAVAFPAQSSYLYFRAACDGSGRHNFAATFEEHQQFACE